MRVRLYEMGSKETGVLFLDQFPAALAINDQGLICCDRNGHAEICCLEEVEGQILFHASRADFETSVNDAPMEDGPLLPGDRLRLGERNFLVSYESTSSGPGIPRRYRIQL